MNSKDVLELKRRLTKDNATFTRISGCYVDGDKNKIAIFNDNFLNLNDEVFFKYLEMAKKVFSGKIGNNILNLPFKSNYSEEKQFLFGLRDSKLKNDELLDVLYDNIIENYDYAGNFLIVVFHDAYDVMTKTSDNAKLDESEEVYEYLLCAICPVNLSKPALGYLTEENRIDARIRDWVVGAPDTGFVFPTFTDRTTDADNVMFYTKNAKEPHMELAESVLGATAKMTHTEKKIAFEEIVENVLGDEDEDTLGKLEVKLNERAEEDVETEHKLSPTLTSDDVVELLTECGVDAVSADAIKKQFDDTFKDDLPSSPHLVYSKTIEKEELKNALIEKINNTSYTSDVNIVVSKELKEQVETREIDSKKYILIPIDENTKVNIVEK